MKKKLIIGGAILIGGLVLLIVIITGAILIYENSINNNTSQGDLNNNQVVRGVISDFRENKFDDAIVDIDKFLLDNPNDIELLLLKADNLLAKGSAQFAEKEFALKAQIILNKVLQLDPENVKAYRLMGYSYEIQNMFNEALINYDKSLDIEELSDTYNWKGHTYDLMGEILKAEEFYKKAIELDDNNQMALRNLSRVYLRLDKKKEARKILERLIEMPVDNISAVAGDYHSLGTIEFDENNKDKAKRLFEKALEIDSSFMLARVELAKFKVLFEEKREEAILELNKISQDFPKQVFPLEWLGFAYLENDEFDKAIEELNKAKELVSSDITLMGEQRILIRSRLNYYLSLAYSLNGNIEKSKECLLKIMEGTDKSTMTMLINSLHKGSNGPYKNIMSDPEVSGLVDQLVNL